MSPVRKNQGADVKFAGGGYLAKGASLPRAYVALYNYGRLFGEARDFCRQVKAMGLGADAGKILGLFGNAGKGGKGWTNGRCFFPHQPVYMGRGSQPWPAFCAQNLLPCTHTSSG